MATTGRLAQRVTLITGGGGEIGGAISKRFAAEGVEVALPTSIQPNPKPSLAPSRMAVVRMRSQSMWQTRRNRIPS
jgi:NAD(P)-dependent dehydrogenase (short-subunit alcohol dehydrogenase family)